MNQKPQEKMDIFEFYAIKYNELSEKIDEVIAMIEEHAVDSDCPYSLGKEIEKLDSIRKGLKGLW